MYHTGRGSDIEPIDVNVGSESLPLDIRATFFPTLPIDHTIPCILWSAWSSLFVRLVMALFITTIAQPQLSYMEWTLLLLITVMTMVLVSFTI